MSEFMEGNATGRFWENLPDIPGFFQERVPTFDRRLDRYFDQNFAAIIGEWGLLKQEDLMDLERRLNRVTGEVKRLSRERIEIEDRVARLDALVTRIEGGRL